MKLHYKYDIHKACKVLLQEHLDKIGIAYEISGLGDIILLGSISARQCEKLHASISRYGIEIIDNPKNAIVQQIKDVIVELVYMSEKLPDSRISFLLSNKLNLSYSYLSRVFSEATFTSIENYLILMRVERVKQLIIGDKLTFTEVAWKLHYSSVAHLSNQFKKTTGLTPTLFQRIIERRNNRLALVNNNNSV